MKKKLIVALAAATFGWAAAGYALANDFVNAQNAAANAQWSAMQQQQANWQASWDATVRAQNAADTAQWNAMHQQQAVGQSNGRGASASCDLLGIYGESCHHQSARIKAQNDREKYAGSLIASGQCVAARDFALKEGDFDLAAKVNSMCASAPAPQPPKPDEAALQTSDAAAALAPQSLGPPTVMAPGPAQH